MSEYRFNLLSLQQKDYLILGDKLRLGISNCTYLQSITLERCEGEIVKLLSINSITACFLITYDGWQD